MVYHCHRSNGCDYVFYTYTNRSDRALSICCYLRDPGRAADSGRSERRVQEGRMDLDGQQGRRAGLRSPRR